MSVDVFYCRPNKFTVASVLSVFSVFDNAWLFEVHDITLNLVWFIINWVSL